MLPAILKKSVSSSGKQPPHAEKTALSRRSGSSRKTAPDPALPHNFLTGNAAEILSLWSEKISENGGSPSPQILKTVLAQFSLLLKPGSPATADSISEENVAKALRMTASLAPAAPGLDLLHIYLVCGESLQQFAQSSAAAKQLSPAARKLLLQQIDDAFSILIHHQIHIFSKPSAPKNTNRAVSPIPEVSFSRQTCSA